MNDIWSEKNAEDALLFLRDTDKEWAMAKARFQGLEKNEKVILGQEILELKGHDGTVGEKEAKARNSTAYKQWLEDHEDAAMDFNLLTAQRNTKQAFLECWRSVYSARKRGNV